MFAAKENFLIIYFMGIFSGIKHAQIKSFIKGAYRTMLVSFLAFEDQMKKGKIEAKLFSDLAAKALSTRPKWKMIEKNIFEHKTGKQIKIRKADTLADVVLSVVLIEMQEFILNDNNPEEIFSVIVEEFQKFFSAPEELTKRNPEYLKTLGGITMNKYR